MACTTCGAFRQRVRLLAPEVRDQIGGVLYELGLGKAGCHSGTGRRNRGSKLKPSCTAQLQKYIAQPRQSTHIVDPGYDRHEDASSRLLNYYESALEEAPESRSSTK